LEELDAEVSKCGFTKFCAELTSAMINFRQGLYKDVVAAPQTPFIVVTCTIVEMVVCPNVLGMKSTPPRADA
jgi:hypothetical protein